jgi:hypothetical protein
MKTKYPRTFHLPYSLEVTKDDKKLTSDEYFLNKEIIITAKLDGSNFCMTSDSCFARSHNGPPSHPSFNWAKSYYNNIKQYIPDNLLIFSEYLFAKHSIYYNNLPDYIFVFNIFNLEDKTWLSWDELTSFCKTININHVPILYQGIIKKSSDLKNICHTLMQNKEFGINEREGVVVRIANSFSENDFSISVAKVVRCGHVQTSEHWKNQEIIKNKLKTS